MSEWIPLSRTRHADQGYIPRDGYAFAAEQSVAPILLAELSRLMPHYMLGFIQENEAYRPVALLGLDGHTNLYVAANGKWLGRYVPASLRGYPFTFAKARNGKQALCLHQAHMSETQGAPLFTEDGQLSETVQRTLDFLQQRERNRLATDVAARALGEAGVIEPWPLQVDRGEGHEPLTVDGLYRVSEKTLNALDGNALVDLRKHGALALAYAQLLSINQLDQLIERLKLHIQQAERQSSAPAETFFGDDDELHFDFGD